MLIADLSVLKDWAGDRLEQADEEVLDRCLGAAQDWVEHHSGRELEQPSSPYVEYFNGCDADGRFGEILRLKRSRGPFTTNGLAIVENGVTLTHVTGYSETADVIFDVERGRLVRNRVSGAGWADGVQNIQVTYQAGYTTDTLPKAIEQLILEVAWLFFKKPAWIGKSSQSRGGSATAMKDQLSDPAKDTLQRLQVWG